jgi:uncharacterized protein with PQ loop repeat
LLQASTFESIRRHVPPLTTLLLTLGISLSLSTQVPQVVRTVFRGSTSGLSAVGIRAGVTANALWLCYGLAAHDPGQVACNLLTTALGTATLVAHRRQHARHHLDLATLALIAVWAGVALVGRADVLAGTGAFLGLVIGLPQLLTLLRTSAAAGVARGTYVLGACASATWSAYWLLDGRPLVAGSSGYSSVLALVGLSALVLRPRARLRSANARGELTLVA